MREQHRPPIASQHLSFRNDQEIVDGICPCLSDHLKFDALHERKQHRLSILRQIITNATIYFSLWNRRLLPPRPY